MSICVGCRSPARVLCVPSRALRAQVVHAMCEALTTTRAVARLHGKTTSFVDGVVASVSTPRLLCFLAMQAFRLIVSSLLCYGGAYFIGHTIALSDLILNCIALEVRSSFRHAVRGCGGQYRAWCDACQLCGEHAPAWCVAVRPARAADKAAQCRSALHDMMCC